MIDTHVHLNDGRLSCRYDEIVNGMRENGLEAVVNIGDDLPSSRLAAAQSRDGVYCALGVHPIASETTTDAEYEELGSLILNTPRCIAVGEIGLDYYYPDPPRAVQKKCFERQIELADRLNRPLVVHVRDAYQDVIEILKKHASRLRGGVIHCYSGSAESAKIFTDMGFSIAFGGAITFRNNVHAPEIIRSIPRERLLLETDCPYLTPVPMRGKADNEPKFVRYVRAKMSEILSLPEEEVDRLTTENFYRTFGIQR